MESKKVYIIGQGMTKFGEFYHADGSALASESFYEALKDANIDKSVIDEIIFGSLVGNELTRTSVAPLTVRNFNLHCPYARIEAGTASGAAAFRHAYLSVKSGLMDTIAVIGVEKLSDFVKAETMEQILSGVIDYQYEFEMGATLTSLFALLTKAHMNEFDTSLEQLAAVPAKNHENGVNNPKAQFRRAIKIDRFLKAKRIADPIGRFDPATFCDGSATVILASEEFVKNHGEIQSAVPILASTQASDTIALHNRESLTELQATVKAAKQAFSLSNLTPSDISFAEVHDSFPIGEVLALEDIGFVKKGEGGKAALDGLTSIGGKIPINTSGGLKARGDPFGATGIAQIIEIIEQMRGIADKRQIENPQYGLTHNVVGTGSSAIVSIFGKDEVKK